MPDWRSPESDEAKLRLIRERWGNCVPNYLVYEIGALSVLSTLDLQEVIRAFFYARRPVPDDITVHLCSELTTQWRVYALQVCGASDLRVSFTFRNRCCPLLKVGHSSPFARGAAENDPKHLNFRALFEVPAEPPRPAE